MDNLTFNTGDIILYNTQKWYSKILEYFLGQQYSHISIILKNPSEWLDEKLNEDIYYILESGIENFPNSESGKITFGVQIVPFYKVYNQYKFENYGHLYIRKLNYSSSSITEQKLKTNIKNAFLNIKNKPYDINIIDWIIGYYELNNNLDTNINLTKYYQKTTSFVCSALVSYIYAECGILDNKIPWTIVTPIDYVNWDENDEYICEKRILPFINNCKLGKLELLC